jgi:hypothetical protein
LFNGGTKYAGIPANGTGDIVADHISAVSGTPITNETFGLTYKIAVPSTQPAGRYSNVLTVGATAIY